MTKALLIPVAIAIATITAASAADSTKLTIGGAGTAIGTLRELGDAYTKSHPEVTVTVLTSLGAVGGVEALRSGSVDIALATRPLTDAEHGKEVRLLQIARERFVFAVGASNKTSSITLKQLLEIYQRKLTTWPDGTPIRLVLRSPAISDTLFLKDLSPEWKKAMEVLEKQPGMLVVATAQLAADRVERTPGAITTSTLNLILTEKRAMNALRIDSVEPDSKAYPYYKPLFLVTLPKPSQSVQQFVAFVQSMAGRDILVRTGNVVPGEGR